MTWCLFSRAGSERTSCGVFVSEDDWLRVRELHTETLNVHLLLVFVSAFLLLSEARCWFVFVSE